MSFEFITDLEELSKDIINRTTNLDFNDPKAIAISMAALTLKADKMLTKIDNYFKDMEKYYESQEGSMTDPNPKEEDK